MSPVQKHQAGNSFRFFDPSTYITISHLNDLYLFIHLLFFQAAALVHIYTDGSVLLTHGGIELGQGIHTKMIQVINDPNINVHFACYTDKQWEIFLLAYLVCQINSFFVIVVLAALN